VRAERETEAGEFKACRGKGKFQGRETPSRTPKRTAYGEGEDSDKKLETTSHRDRGFGEGLAEKTSKRTKARLGGGI